MRFDGLAQGGDERFNWDLEVPGQRLLIADDVADHREIRFDDPVTQDRRRFQRF